MAELTAPGEAFELADAEVNGNKLKVWTNAANSLRDLCLDTAKRIALFITASACPKNRPMITSPALATGWWRMASNPASVSQLLCATIRNGCSAIGRQSRSEQLPSG